MADDIWPDHPSESAPPPPAAPAGSYLEWPDHPAEAAPPGTFFPRHDNLLPNASYGPTDVAVHGMTAGLTDPLRALKSAGVDWLATQLGANAQGSAEPETRGFDFQRRWEEIARGRRQYEQANPIASTAASLAGAAAFAPASIANMAVKAGTAPTMRELADPRTLGRIFGRDTALAPELTTAAATPAPSLGRQMVTGGAIGGGGGLITGAADNPERPGMGAVSQGPVGLGVGVGMPVASRLLSGFGRASGNYMNPEGRAQENALDRLRGLIHDDISTGSPSLAVADQQLGDTRAPKSLADIYPSVSKYLGTLYDSWSPAANNIFNLLNQRDIGAGRRLVSTTGQTVAAGPEQFGATQALMAQRTAASRPAYGAFEMQPPANPDLFNPASGEMTALFRRPAIKDGVREARDIIANRGGNPNSLGITFNEAGDPVFQKVPSWQMLDYVRQGIDEVVNKANRNPITNRLNLGTGGSAQMAALQDFTKVMDRENSLYPVARAAFSGPSQSQRALELGFDFRDHSAAEQRYALSTLAPGDRDFYQQGAANRIRADIGRTHDAQDEAKKIADSDEMRKRLRPAFNTDAEYNDFMQHVADERQVFQTGYNISRNSFTARRLGAMQAEAPPSGVSLAIPAAAMTVASGGATAIPHALAVGGAVAAGHQASRGYSRAVQLAMGNSPQMQNTAASLALAPGQAGRQVIGLLQAPQERLQAPTWLPGVMAGMNPAAPFGTGLLAAEPLARGLVAPLSYRPPDQRR